MLSKSDGVPNDMIYRYAKPTVQQTDLEWVAKICK